jgi:hypothetical protein
MSQTLLRVVLCISGQGKRSAWSAWKLLVESVEWALSNFIASRSSSHVAESRRLVASAIVSKSFELPRVAYFV